MQQVFKSLKFGCQKPAVSLHTQLMLPGHHCLIDADPVSRLLMRGQSPSPLQPVWVNTNNWYEDSAVSPLQKKLFTIPHLKTLFTPLYPPFSGPHLVSLTRQSSPPPLRSLPPAAEPWCYLPISSYWSPERAQSSGNQDPQTVLWRKSREWDNRLDDEGTDPLKTAGFMEVGIADSNRPHCVPASPNWNKKQPGTDDKDGVSVISWRYGE